jgi:PhnB protein
MNTTKFNGTVQPYLFFNGCCEEAIEFYRQNLGAEVVFLMRFKDAPQPHQPGMCAPGSENKVMHATINIGAATILASDGRCTGKTNFDGFSLSITVKTEAEATQIFNALTNGGKVEMPLTKTFFSPLFGSVEDRFGLSWMVYVRP